VSFCYCNNFVKSKFRFIAALLNTWRRQLEQQLTPPTLSIKNSMSSYFQMYDSQQSAAGAHPPQQPLGQPYPTPPHMQQQQRMHLFQ
jgi:hypothetical protein